MYDVEKHREDYGRTAQRIKICDLAPLKGGPVELWEESICGFHFRTILYIGGAGHYFASAATAFQYLEHERKQRYRKRYHENPVRQYYTE